MGVVEIVRDVPLELLLLWRSSEKQRRGENQVATYALRIQTIASCRVPAAARQQSSRLIS